MSEASTTETSRSRAIIPVLMISAFCVILNETTMNVALTSIMDDLGVTERTAQWLTTAFMLTMAVVIPVTGWMLDRLSTRKVFIIAMVTFSIGTLLCIVAPDFSFLLFGRVVQATGTAIMMPLLMTTIMQIVPSTNRGAVMGNVSMVIAVAPAVGPTLSGLVLQVGSWRLIFVVVLPIALLMLGLGIRFLVNVGEKKKLPLDVLSVALTVLAFAPLIYGLSQIGAADVAPWVPIVTIGTGVVGLAAFTARQLVLQRRDQAFLDLRTFTSAPFTVSLTMLAVGMMAMFGSIIMLPLLLQKAYGMEAIQVGLMMLPGGIAMGILAPIVGRIFDRSGPRVLVIPASVIVLGAFYFFSTMTLSTPWWHVMVAHMLMSASFACIFTPLFTVALGSLPKHLYSHGSAVIGAVQQVAGAAGTALFVTVFAMQTVAATPTAPSEAAAMLAGSHWAFLGAGVVWLGAIVCGFFVGRPANSTEIATAH